MLHSPQILLASRKAAAAIAAPPTWIATDHPASQNTGTTSVTFTAVSIGAASSDRIVVALFNSTVALATGMTFNGSISAIKAIEESSGISGLQIWYAAVPTGTTANIVVTSSGNMSNESIIVGILTGVTAAPPNTSFDVPGSADPSSISVTVPSTGFGIVGIYNTPTLVNWTGATEDFRVTDAGSALLVMAHTAVAGTNTVQANTFSGGSHHMVSASWGP